MSFLNINFDDVPDKNMPLPAGEYVFLVNAATLEPTKDGSSQKIVVEMTVDDEQNPNNGRKVFDHISVKMTTNIKRLFKSAGLKPGAGGVDVSDLVGKHVRALVKLRAYKDPSSGETRETASVDSYLFEE